MEKTFTKISGSKVGHEAIHPRTYLHWRKAENIRKFHTKIVERLFLGG